MILPLLVLCGALCGLGLFALVHTLFIRPVPDVAQALQRLSGRDIIATPEALIERQPAPTTMTEKLGAWGERNLAHRSGLVPPTRDLSILGRSTRDYYGEKIGAALIGLFAIPLFSLICALLGISMPLVPAFVGLVLAGLFWFMPDLDIKKQAAEARREFTEFTVAYLQLIAIARSAGRAPAETMLEAAAISDSWVMRRIRQELTRGQFAGRTPWQSLEQLSSKIEIPEIGEVADIMRVAAEQGASVKEQLLARATGLQHRLLTDEEAEANAMTVKMSLPISALFTVLVIALVIPIVGAFSGV